VLIDFLGPASWKIIFSRTVTSCGVPTQVLIARPRARGQNETGFDPRPEPPTAGEVHDEDQRPREP
jgi:hypothetical protein